MNRISAAVLELLYKHASREIVTNERFLTTADFKRLEEELREETDG